jgi:hypothetical protein
MIKFKANKLIGIGLSDSNLKKLKSQPIKFNLKEVGGPDYDFFIFNGKTEASMKRELEHLLSDKTIIKNGIH